ncbi:MAG: hypothetical protein F6K17_22800 [Okeania sp. SIO3C4]|nr:hypothetical protein [Okeania sp. SIO3B3]NER05218.1 hypothetical protein [Okeania sp. SIO3C4]
MLKSKANPVGCVKRLLQTTVELLNIALRRNAPFYLQLNGALRRIVKCFSQSRF